MAQEITISPRAAKSPFFEATVAAGATGFTIYNHMYMPTGYGDPEAEYWRLIDGVSMWDVACERQVELAGPDAGRLADYLATRDLSGLGPGIGRYTCLCDHRGRLHNDPVVLRVEEDLWWFSIADNASLLFARAIAGELSLDVEIREPDVSPLAIQGPKAMAVAAALLGEWVRDLGYFHFRTCEVEGIPLVVQRSGFSKQGGVELYLRDGTRGLHLWGLVAEAGRPYAIAAGTPNTIERLESGLFNFSSDNDADTNPFELALERYVDLDAEADFVGKAALRTLARRPPARRRTGAVLDGPPLGAASAKCPVRRGDETVGFVGGHAFSPRLKANVAVALIETAALAAGNLVAETEAGPRALEPRAFPLV